MGAVGECSDGPQLEDPEEHLRIDIGGGTIPNEGYVNLDPEHGEGEWKRLAQDVPWPTDDESVDDIVASHVLEHIPAGKDRINVMNEAWRVLVPGGKLKVFLPLVGYTDNFDQPHHCGWQAFADPTHVSYWWFPESLHYFYGDSGISANADYGIKDWNVGDIARDETEINRLLSLDPVPCFWGVRGGWEGVAILEKPGEYVES